jgi:FtsP/CotA-like multicopper oxidase with cupredoxin domain
MSGRDGKQTGKETRAMRVLAAKTSRVALLLIVASAGLVLSGGPASAQPVTIDLCAEAGTWALPGGVTAPVWGYGLATVDAGNQPTCAGVAAQVPGPVLDIAQNAEVTVVVHNDLDQAVGYEVPGQVINEGAITAPAHAAASFTFTASAPGTYLYESTANAGRQLAMGLYGALIVRSATPGQAYGTASTAFDQEAVLVLSAIDPLFNANPDSYDMHQYLATYWLINGKAYPQTDPIHGVAPGTRLLLRYVNAGYDNTTMALLGMHEQVVARDAHPLANPFSAVAETIPAGATEDSIATIPATGHQFALYNRQLHLTNGTASSPNHTPGGMMTFVVVP